MNLPLTCPNCHAHHFIVFPADDADQCFYNCTICGADLRPEELVANWAQPTLLPDAS